MKDVVCIIVMEQLNIDQIVCVLVLRQQHIIS